VPLSECHVTDQTEITQDGVCYEETSTGTVEGTTCCMPNQKYLEERRRQQDDEKRKQQDEHKKVIGSDALEVAYSIKKNKSN